MGTQPKTGSLKRVNHANDQNTNAGHGTDKKEKAADARQIWIISSRRVPSSDKKSSVRY